MVRKIVVISRLFDFIKSYAPRHGVLFLGYTDEIGHCVTAYNINISLHVYAHYTTCVLQTSHV